jgi:pimeloyl-ACP methyl ester carboxylesterase
LSAPCCRPSAENVLFLPPPQPRAPSACFPHEATRRHYAELYARPGAIHSAFNQFAAFTQDAIDNRELAAKGKLAISILALGADHSFGTQLADDLRFVASDVTGGIINNSGHWIMEEQPAQTVATIRAFLDKK